MPKKCCVIGCKGGYDSNREKVSTFKFPSDQNLKKKWLEAIGRKDYKATQWAAVCEKHFRDDDIIRHCIGINPQTGAEILTPTKVRLKEGAIPAINLRNSVEPRNKAGKKRGRPPKSVEPQSDHSSSDEDIPLETLKNQYSSSKDEETPAVADTSTVEDKITVERFLELLDQYEKLKDKHVALGHEIEVLEKVNIDLKCKIFQF